MSENNQNEITPSQTETVNPTPPPLNQTVQPNKKTPMIAIIIIFFVLAGGGYYFMTMSKNSTNGSTSSNPLQTMAQKSPYDALSAALNKDIAATTAYMEYKTQVTSSLSQAKTGVTQTLHSNIDGSISGSTDGKTTDMEMKIYSAASPDTSVNVSVMNTANGDWYVRNAQTAPKWQKLTKAQYEQVNAGPIDASLFGLNILGTIFSSNQALFKSFTKESVTKITDPNSTISTFNDYQVEVSTPAYLAALAKDKDITQKEISDTKQILQDAILTVLFSVDKNSGYVTKIHIDGKRLTQIPTPQSEQLGISTTHDILLDATMSRFNVPTNITAPESGNVLGVATTFKKPTLLK